MILFQTSNSLNGIFVDLQRTAQARGRLSICGRYKPASISVLALKTIIGSVSAMKIGRMKIGRMKIGRIKIGRMEIARITNKREKTPRIVNKSGNSQKWKIPRMKDS